MDGENRGMMNRRAVLKAAGAGLAAAALPAGRLRAATGPALARPVPASGEALPVIGMGSSRTFEGGSEPEVRDNLGRVLQAFFDGGGAVIDSSPMYGAAETVLGALFPQTTGTERRFMATKVWTRGREAGIRQMRQSFARLGVERMDLMQVHNLVDWRVQLETLRRWKDEGRIRYLGITTSHRRARDEFAGIMTRERLDFVQFSYSIADRSAERRLLPLAADRGIATLINRPFERGSVFRRVRGEPLPEWAREFDCASWGQYFLKYIVSHPGATCAIPATSKVHHMEDNMGAGFGRLPDASLRRRMERHFDAL